MSLIIDINEKDTDHLIDKLEKNDIEFSFRRLSVGDYRVQYKIVGENNKVAVMRINIGIEKKAKDFYSSAISGLLLEQCFRLTKTFYHSILIIEGDMYEQINARKGVTKKFLNKIMIKAMLQRAIDGAKGAVSVIHTKNFYETSITLINIYNLLQKEENLWTLPVIPTTKVNKNVKFLIVHILSAFPNVGNKRAKTLLLHFKSFESIINATLEELLEVKGIGKETAESIIKTRSFCY